ncbi:hypothetical protein [Moorena bouillonii]|nr:hypothetical protein [Moorena bouillonii]
MGRWGDGESDEGRFVSLLPQQTAAPHLRSRSVAVGQSHQDNTRQF